MHSAHLSTQRWLEAFRPNAGEQEAKARMLALLDQEDNATVSPFTKAHTLPGHFTASAFVLSSDGRHLALIFHGKLHRWLQPGGHFEKEDVDLVAAAKREVTEEIGVAPNALALVESSDGPIFDLDIHEIPARKTDPTHEHFDIRVLFQTTSDVVTAGSDAKDARWVSLTDITEEMTDASVMRAVEKIRRHPPNAVR